MSGLGRGGWVRVVGGAALVAGVFALLAVHGFKPGASACAVFAGGRNRAGTYQKRSRRSMRRG